MDLGFPLIAYAEDVFFGRSCVVLQQPKFYHFNGPPWPGLQSRYKPLGLTAEKNTSVTTRTWTTQPETPGKKGKEMNPGGFP